MMKGTHGTKRKLFAAILMICALVLVPGAQPSQPPQQPDTADIEAMVARQVTEFYQGYWMAWERNSFREITARLAPEFVVVSIVPGQGAVQIGREAAVESVRQFVDAVRGQETLWRFRLLSMFSRGEREAVVALRTELTWLGGAGQDEISLEVLRKDDSGQWLLVRKTTERRTRQ